MGAKLHKHWTDYDITFTREPLLSNLYIQSLIWLLYHQHPLLHDSIRIEFTTKFNNGAVSSCSQPIGDGNNHNFASHQFHLCKRLRQLNFCSLSLATVREIVQHDAIVGEVDWSAPECAGSVMGKVVPT